MRALEVPLATSWEQLQELPAMLVGDYRILMAGIREAEEWQRLESQRKRS